jgi:hypothetical protein
VRGCERVAAAPGGIHRRASRGRGGWSRNADRAVCRPYPGEGQARGRADERSIRAARAERRTGPDWHSCTRRMLAA